MKSANSCPANRAKNRAGLRKAHAEGRVRTFSDADRAKSHVSHRRKLVESRPFEELGHKLRKKIVMEEQDYKCLHCENDEWMGLRITLELDHIDGDTNNNVRENLRCLCPNCHSITDTWKRGQFKKLGVRKVPDEEIIEAYLEHGTLTKTLKACGLKAGSFNTVKKVLFRHKLIDEI